MQGNILSISKIISASSRMINSLQSILPLYEEITPIINKIKTLSKRINTGKNIIEKEEINTDTNKKEESVIYASPQFFL